MSYLLVSFLIAFEFFAPEGCIGFWYRCSFTSGMLMPEAPMQEDTGPVFRQDDIRRTGKIAPMQTEAVTKSMQETADNLLRFRVFAPHC